jgi:hypothetical protein
MINEDMDKPSENYRNGNGHLNGNGKIIESFPRVTLGSSQNMRESGK